MLINTLLKHENFNNAVVAMGRFYIAMLDILAENKYVFN